MNYDQQGSGEPLLLIPYLAVEHACYAFQVADYSKHFSCVRGWQVMVKATSSVAEMVIQGIFPWCFTPELYAQKPDYIQALSDFVRSRPKQPVDAFIQQSDAAIAHDAEAQLSKIRAPTQITFGRHDILTIRFADRLRNGVRKSEFCIFEDCSHVPLYENVPAFNEKTLGFLTKHMG